MATYIPHRISYDSSVFLSPDPGPGTRDPPGDPARGWWTKTWSTASSPGNVRPELSVRHLETFLSELRDPAALVHKEPVGPFPPLKTKAPQRGASKKTHASTATSLLLCSWCPKVGRKVPKEAPTVANQSQRFKLRVRLVGLDWWFGDLGVPMFWGGYTPLVGLKGQPKGNQPTIFRSPKKRQTHLKPWLLQRVPIINQTPPQTRRLRHVALPKCGTWHAEDKNTWLPKPGGPVPIACCWVAPGSMLRHPRY